MGISANKLTLYPDRVSGDHKPITADVFLTNYCNNNCGFCTYHRWELDAGSYGMTSQEFAEYLRCLLSYGVKGVILTGGGEPMINPDFERICEIMDAQNIPYGINTNMNVLKFCKPRYLKVSLDGWDRESYKKIRGVDAYDKVRDNIIAYCGWKKIKSPNTNVGIQKIVTDVDEIIKFYEANKDLPVDYIVFRPVESTDGSFYMDRMEDVERAISIIESLCEIDNRVIMNYKWSLIGKKFGKCEAHWAQIAVDERGNVIYCCHKPYEIVGHVTDKYILSKLKHAKTNMCKCDVPCRMTAPNCYIEELNDLVGDKEFI